MRIIETAKRDLGPFLERLLKRGDEDFRAVDEQVAQIMEAVRTKGDEALLDYTERFDGVRLETVRVEEAEVEEALARVDGDFMETLKKAAENIRRYHEHQLEKTWKTEDERGTVLGQIVRPLARVGIYVPGGKAAYPSTVLMNALPAQVAGVGEIAMATPPGPDGAVDPHILAAAKVAGIREIYKMGGAQAVAALAFGTGTVPKVDKITGPGNIYVARAKQAVFGRVDIDMIAGPSEILVIADEGQNPAFIAADLLSQAEHDELAGAILATPSRKLAEAVSLAVEAQLEKLERRAIARASIDSHGFIFLTRTLEEAFDLANAVAPEHLELLIEGADRYVPLVRNAGAVFVGPYSPEPVGDYFAGPNHTLPTSGTARFSSALGTYDFVKKTSYIQYSKEALASDKDHIMRFAAREGLTAHANSIKVRFENND